MPFEEGVLPVKYLGVPLISSGLFHKDCKILVERVKIKIEDWKNKSLSFAGEMKRGNAKVKWDIVCLPKEDGGLGIRRLKTWNLALMTTHIWSILSNRQSLWVKWINSYRLKDRNFWDIPVKSNSSYGWRKILQMQNVVRRFFFHVVGKGNRKSAWFDKWLDEGPFDAIISRRDIHRGGFNTDSVVHDLLRDNAWAWPAEWLGNTQSFIVANVWNSIRPRSNKVDWFDVVWFSQSILRHSFLVWLLIRERLKTEDKLKAWEVESSVNIDNLKCTLCRRVQDSHAHPFFECGFSLQVWSMAKVLIHFPSVDNSWRSFVMDVKPIAQMRWAKVIVAKRLFGATVYFVWQ
ncbi:putative reverse transcriptase domain, reverse transcriptase zinc-binding domain protein [Tanacetum coccineum]|uniref:Reverse transcriptase domain, reverse transcriptase zinc-binding domain protein n=1 Tax=Tanacetum coccineum TaxID=301880 RepID=A0ABQ5HTA2_9ASTR